MPGKISVTGIIKAHFATLKNYGLGRMRPLDVATFTLLPLLIALSPFYPGIAPSSEAVKLLALPAPVLTAAIALLLSTVYRIASSYDCHRTKSRLEREFIREIVSNVFYCLLTGSLSTLAAFLTLIFQEGFMKLTANALLLFLVSSFFITLFMVLNRCHVLIAKTCTGDDRD